MESIVFKEGATAPFKLIILIREKYLNKEKIEQYYIDPLVKQGLNEEDIVCIGLRYINDKALKKDSIEWIVNNLVILIKDLKATTLAIASSEYFKHITGNLSSKFIKSNCKSNIEGLENIRCVPIINYRSLGYNASLKNKLKLSLEAIPNALSVISNNQGKAIKNTYYPKEISNIRDSLLHLMDYPKITADVETFGLLHQEAGLGTIAFSTDQDTAIGFLLQYKEIGKRCEAEEEFLLLKQFLEDYKGTLIFHGGSFDIKMLVYNLFMDHDRDYKGLVHGLNQFTNIEDTMLLTYVCTNNCVQNVLNLKDNVLEFSGNYAIDVKDITIHEPDLVLQYNGEDTTSTFYLYNKYYDKMIREQLEESYRIMVDFILVNVHLQILGFPMSMDHSKELYETIEGRISGIYKSITDLTIVSEFLEYKLQQAVFEFNLNTPSKITNISVHPEIVLNLNSDKQLADLIHDYLEIEVIDETKTGLPSMSADSLLALSHTVTNTDVKLILDKLVELKSYSTNQNNFIKKFVQNTVQKSGEGAYYLHGELNIGGTISGRPTGGGTCNLLALPSTGSVLASPVKQCFRLPDDRLMVGSDYAGQEDYCASVVSRDKEMLKGKILGLDGHSQRALAYFPELLPIHTKKLKDAETATKFYIDDSKTGVNKYECE